MSDYGTVNPDSDRGRVMTGANILFRVRLDAVLFDDAVADVEEAPALNLEAILTRAKGDPTRIVFETLAQIADQVAAGDRSNLDAAFMWTWLEALVALEAEDRP